MSRYSRNALILAKVETTAGVDAAPTGAANALLVANLTINPLKANNVSRDLVRPFFGGSEQLVGTATVEVSFDVELAASGTAGTAPAWGPLLLGCAFAEAVTAGSRVDYTPVTTGLKTLTLYYYDDGVLHKLLGAMGDVEIKAGIGERPLLSFKFEGIDGGVSAATATGTYTPWKKPLVVTDPNTGDILLGCTYSAGALSGGTSYPSRGFNAKMGNSVVYTPLLGGDSIDITNRDVTGSIQLDLTPAQEVAMFASVKANTTQGVGFTHGTTAGSQVMVFAPNVQLINPSKQDVSGRRLIGFDLRMTPSAGNDDVRIVCL
ncbi:phage tail tube protein [Zoogloea sp.]|uniref:phage tail tube protein n=1 Tax=Zoogloea sp. TaxID=49181 RepID=UPI00260B4653|nr:phage tail tube protein [Zoogloea sp.]